MLKRIQAGCAAAMLILVASCSAAAPGSTTTTNASTASALSAIDLAMVTAEPAGKLNAGGVEATIPQLGEFPGLAIAQENLRTEILQRAAWQGATEVKVSTRVIASGKYVVGLLTSAIVSGETRLAAVYYHIGSNTAVGPTALIEPTKWADFIESVRSAPGGEPLAGLLSKQSYPSGEAPVIGFAGNGDLVVQTGTAAVTIPADQAIGWLTPFGTQVLGAATHPSKATRQADAVKADDAVFGAASNDSQRPAITLGPDCAKLKCVALTFDDGPVTATDDLLTTLRSKSAPATFFTLGNSVDKAEAAVQRSAALGNQIGWHSASHASLPSLNDARLEQEVGTGATRLLGLIGNRPLFFRPPYGAHNKRVDQVIAKHQMASIMWDVDTRDWDKTKATGAALSQAVVRSAVDTARNGSIVLMHDIHDTSRAAAGEVIDGLRARGFTLVTIGELAGATKYSWGKSYCAAPATPATCW